MSFIKIAPIFFPTDFFHWSKIHHPFFSPHLAGRNRCHCATCLEDTYVASFWLPYLGGFNQPIWKIWGKIGNLPQVGMEIKKFCNHHLVLVLVCGKGFNTSTLRHTGIAMENNIPIFPHKYHQNRPFFMAMLVHRSVPKKTNSQPTWNEADFWGVAILYWTDHRPPQPYPDEMMKHDLSRISSCFTTFYVCFSMFYVCFSMFNVCFTTFYVCFSLFYAWGFPHVSHPAESHISAPGSTRTWRPTLAMHQVAQAATSNLRTSTPLRLHTIDITGLQNFFTHKS